MALTKDALEAIREVVAEQAAEVTTPDIPVDAGAKDQKQRNHLAKGRREGRG
jgi:hypothetical protein